MSDERMTEAEWRARERRRGCTQDGHPPVLVINGAHQPQPTQCACGAYRWSPTVREQSALPEDGNTS